MSAVTEIIYHVTTASIMCMAYRKTASGECWSLWFDTCVAVLVLKTKFRVFEHT